MSKKCLTEGNTIHINNNNNDINNDIIIKLKHDLL